MKLALKARAVDLRSKGWSYNIIASRLGVSKSTLSYWLREVPYRPNNHVRLRIRNGPAKAAEVISRKRLTNIRKEKLKGQKIVGSISQRDLLILGIALYIGEGSKAQEDVQIINADPNVIRLAMLWFREICQVPTENFSATIHIYPDNSERESTSYWSRITGIKKSQFGKAQKDLRKNKSKKKRRLLPYGTVQIKIRSRGNPELGVTLHRRIMGMIEAIYEQAGIV